MKSFVPTMKLSEPIKPAEKSKQVDNNQQTNKQNNEGADQRNSFQAMLNRQVQDKQLENQRLQLKQTQVNNANIANKSSEISEQDPSTEVSKSNIGTLQEIPAMVKDQIELVQSQTTRPTNPIKATPLQDKVLNINTQAVDRLEMPVEADHYSPIVDTNSAALTDKKSDPLIAQQKMDDTGNINAQFQAIVLNQPVNSISKAVTQAASEENSKATIDVMVDQKLAADLRQKSMNKTDLNEDKFDKSDDKTRVVSEKEEGVNSAFQDKINQMQSKSDKGVNISQTLNQTVSQHQSKEHVGHYEAIKSMLPNEASIRSDINTNSQGMMNVQANMQQAVMPTNANMMAAQVGGTQFIPQAFGKPGWSEAINQRVMYMVNASEQTATLTLNPPDLGLLQVVISVNNDKADTTFISNNADVRQALQDGMDNLREKMSEAGISLGQSNVNSGAQQQANQQSSGLQGGGNLSNTLSEPVDHSPTKVIVNNGLVDLFA